MHAYGFDERDYAEAVLPITIMGFPCKVPLVWIPDNHTTWDQLEAVPTIYRSKSFLKQAETVLECNGTVTSTSVSLIENYF